MVNLFDPPPTANLPLSLGRDVVLSFKNKVPGSNPAEYVDFPAGTVIKLVIGKGDRAVEGTGTVSGHEAECRIAAEHADTVKDGAPWRLIVETVDGQYAEAEVPLNGLVVRHDGA